MVFNWLKSNNKSKTKSRAINLKHYVLETTLNAPLNTNEEEILFGCGCFWGAEKGFWKLPGVISTSVGYAGGNTENPNYREVCSGNTGHAEVVRVVWNKTIIDLSDLLKLFWECHDPTQGNRQGNDSGTQYRSTIFTTTMNQYSLALASKVYYQEELLNNGFNKITTEIRENVYYNYAEDYHQQYLAKPGSRPYCSAMPTKVNLGNFKNCNYKLDSKIWDNYDWEITHCILQGDNSPIKTI